MCGRYAIRMGDAALEVLLGFSEMEQGFGPRYNVAPSQRVPVVRAGDGATPELTAMRWGLVPPWSKNAGGGYPMINARAETLGARPAFRTPYRRRRCLVPADGFYEWQALAGRKQPWFIGLTDDAPFCFAGLWERWQRDGEAPLESCTIITTAANERIAALHERMPVILAPGDHAQWLDPAEQDASRLDPLLRPYSADAMVAWPVSTHVNSARNDDPRCVEPIADAELAAAPPARGADQDGGA